jgi:uncharacterized membrane protein
MEPDQDRVTSLEADVRRLEARIARLETAAPVLRESAATLGLPPPPIVAAVPTDPARPAQAAWASKPSEPAATTSAPNESRSSWSALPTTPGLTLRDLEERFAGRALALVGGFALVAAAIFFLSLAFSRGWVTEPMRVAIGIVAGAAVFTGGAWRLSREDRLLGGVLAGVGIGVLEVAIFAATSLYHLLPAEAGLLGALAIAVAAAAVAIRFDVRAVAAYGLVAALVAPPLVGAPPTLLTLGFLAIVLAGTTAIALFRTWSWLPPIAFLLTAPQLGSWIIGTPDVVPALTAIAGFWFVNLVAAAGEEVRIRRDDLRPSSAGLVVADAVFLVWGGLAMLSGTLEPWRGLFVLLAALTHLAVGTWFLQRQGWQHLFGNLVAGTGAALVAVAALVQLDAPVVAGAWAAEAVALTWLAVRRRHRWSALAAAAMLALAMTDVAAQYLLTVFDTQPRVVPNGELIALGAVLLGTAVAGWLVADRWIRSLLLAAATLLVAWAVLFEAHGSVAIGLWALLLPLAAGADRLLAGLPDDRELRRDWRVAMPTAGKLPPGTAAGIVAWIAALAVALGDLLDPRGWGSVAPPAVPLTDERALVAAVLAATVIAGGALVGWPLLRHVAAVLGIAVIALVAPFEVYADLVVVAWTGLAVAAVAYLRWERAPVLEMTTFAVALVAAAAVVAFTIVTPPIRLVVVDPVAVSRPALLPLWPLSFVALAAVLLAAPRHRPLAQWGSWLQLAGGAVAVYAVSIGVVAGFQRLVGGSVSAGELAAQAQVALSVTWTTLGVIALGAGLATRRALPRQGGLGLLALATAKVFLVDLAALDVAYRAVVLAGLGVLLLLGAWVVTRFRGPRATLDDGAEEPNAAG